MSTSNHKHLDPETARRALAEAHALGQDRSVIARRWKVRIAAGATFALVFALYVAFVFMKYDWQGAQSQLMSGAKSVQEEYQKAFNGNTNDLSGAIKDKFTRDAKDAIAADKDHFQNSLPASPDAPKQ